MTNALKERPIPAPMNTTQRLQAAMRRGADGRIVCKRCGGQVRYGWCYKFGPIVLATCAKPRCQQSAPWILGIRFV